MKTRALKLKQAGLSTRQIAKVLEEEFGERVNFSTISRWLNQSVANNTQVSNATLDNNPPQAVTNNTQVSNVTPHNPPPQGVTNFTQVKNVTPNNTSPHSVAKFTWVKNATLDNNPPQKEEEFKQLDPKKELLEFILADAELYKYDPLPHIEREGLLDLLTEEHWERVNQIWGCYLMINLLLV